MWSETTGHVLAGIVHMLGIVLVTAGANVLYSDWSKARREARRRRAIQRAMDDYAIQLGLDALERQLRLQAARNQKTPGTYFSLN